MTKASSKMNPKVDWYFLKDKKWQDEVIYLRELVLACGLDEELKWGVPCYSSEKKNIVLIHKFKDYCAILFFKGVLLKDSNGILIQQTANVQAARQIRFKNVNEIVKLRAVIKTYLKEAIAIEKSGLKAELKKTQEFELPDEFKNKMDEFPELKKGFYSLTPGRQRAYLLYFSSAKQSVTRSARILKYMKKIISGKGIDD